ncbi:MAG: efflux RND transporter permease subunit, partial [Desulfobacterales bacterium]|nr:efflux RND transporter permease subunit [Desulfobacterales bacterium]
SEVIGRTGFEEIGEDDLETFSEAGFEDEQTGETGDSGGSVKKPYLTDAENSRAVEAVEEIVARHTGEGFELHITGSAAVTHFIKATMMKDMLRFIGLAVGAIALFLFFMFRRLTGVFSPLVVTLLSLLGTVSIMAVCGKSIKLPTQILPSFLLAVSVGDAVHILALFYKKLRETHNKREAVIYAVGHSGLAIVLTSVTTAGGLLSFCTAEVAPVADLGIFAACGVMLAMLITFLVLPALLAVSPAALPETKAGSGEHTVFDRLLVGTGKFSMAHSKMILGITLMIIGLSVYGALKMKFSHAPLEWLPKDNPVRLATEMADRDLRGSVTLEAVLDTKMKNGLYTPDFMKRLALSEDEMETFEDVGVFVGKVTSISAIVKETNMALNENRSDFYTIPDSRELIAQEILLFENSGSDDLLDVTEGQLQKARLILKAPFKDALLYEPLIQRIRTYLETTYPECDITLTGMMALFFETLANAVKTMAKSYVYALIMVTLLMILLIGDLKMGLLSMVPNLTSILITLGIIGWFQIPMSLFTMLVGNIAIGLAVDDTVHFMHNFRLYYKESGQVATAVRRTFFTAGRAMLVTSLVLSVGFFIFMLAGMNNLYDFGLLTGITILTALLANFLVTPALLTVVYKDRTAARARRGK